MCAALLLAWRVAAAKARATADEADPIVSSDPQIRSADPIGSDPDDGEEGGAPAKKSHKGRKGAAGGGKTGAAGGGKKGAAAAAAAAAGAPGAGAGGGAELSEGAAMEALDEERQRLAAAATALFNGAKAGVLKDTAQAVRGNPA